MVVSEGLLIVVAVVLNGVSWIGVECGIWGIDASREGSGSEARSPSPSGGEHGLAEWGDPAIESGLSDGTGGHDRHHSEQGVTIGVVGAGAVEPVMHRSPEGLDASVRIVDPRLNEVGPESDKGIGVVRRGGQDVRRG